MNSAIRISFFHTYGRSRPALTLFASFKPSPTLDSPGSIPIQLQQGGRLAGIKRNTNRGGKSQMELLLPPLEVLLDMGSSMKAPARLE
jgi:hypothetical protein